MDVSEFSNYVPSIYNQTFFLEVFDSQLYQTNGTLMYFAVGNWSAVGTPCQTVNNQNMFFNVTYNPYFNSTITLFPAGDSVPIFAPNYFQVPYYLNGQLHVAQAQNGTLTLIADGGTNITIFGVSSNSNSTEQWVLNSQNASVTIPVGSSVTFYYYEILNQQVAYAVSGGGSPIVPTLTYFTAPSTSSSQLNQTAKVSSLFNITQQTFMVLRGTNASVSNNIFGVSQDQWATPISSWNISQVSQIPGLIIYFHQFQVTANYTSSDGSVPSSLPCLSGTRFGLNFQLHLSLLNQTTWSDANTQWSISSIITAPSGTEQWNCMSSTSGNVTQTILINPSYIHQYFLTVISPFGESSGQGWYKSGSVAYASLNSNYSSGTGVQSSFISWSIGGTNYLQSNAINMNSVTTVNANWNTQYYLTVNSPYGSPSGSGWFNAGTLANFNVTDLVSGGSGIQYEFASWTGGGLDSYSGTSVNGNCIMNNPVTESASWNTQFYLTIISSYGSPSGGGWYNAGATATFSVTTPFSDGAGTQYVLDSWIGSGSGSYEGSFPSYSIPINNPITEEANWATQYQLTFVVTPSGCGSTTPTGTLWENSNPFSLSATPNSSYVFPVECQQRFNHFC